MADFIQNSQTKTAVRELASPIADVTAFNTIVQSVITDNPFGCVAYMTAGENHTPVEKTREGYTARLVYEDAEANNIGSGSHRFNTLAGVLHRQTHAAVRRARYQGNNSAGIHGF